MLSAKNIVCIFYHTILISDNRVIYLFIASEVFYTSDQGHHVKQMLFLFTHTDKYLSYHMQQQAHLCENKSKIYSRHQ
jgi:hypothetical protein